MKRHLSFPLDRVFCLLTIFALVPAFAAAQDLKARPQGGALLRLHGAFDVPAASGADFGAAAPLAAAVADIDGDGLDDLVAGHQNAVSLQRGDINAFAPQTQDAWEAIRDLRYVAPFENERRFVALPFAAEFVVAGDFTRDGRTDLVAAARGGDRLALIERDAKGNLVFTCEILLGGNLTALAAGDVGRPDGLLDLVAGVGDEVLLYQGLGDVFDRDPQRVETAGPVFALAVGQLDADGFADVAAGHGGGLSLIAGSEGKAEARTLAKGFAARALVAGDFVPDRAFRQELAVLDAAGAVRIFARGDLDTRPVSPTEQLAAAVREMVAKNMPVSPRVMEKLQGADWRAPLSVVESGDRSLVEYDRFDAVAPDGLVSPNAALASGKLSNYGEDLIVLDAAANQIVVMPLVAGEQTSEKVSYAGRRESVRFSLDSAPVAAFAARLNFDGDRDLLVLASGKPEAAALVTAPEAAFTVNSNLDQVDAAPGNGVCATAGGVCTLRAAIMEANRLAGNDSITINAGLNITLSAGRADNDALGENSAAYGDLDIFCAINAFEDACTLPLASNNNDLSITGAVGGNTISVGTFTVSSGTGVTTDRVFDIGMDGVFGGGFGGGTGLDVSMSNLTIQNGNVREDFNSGTGSGNYARGGAIRMDGFGQSGARGSLTLTGVTLSSNQADHDSGGIFNQYSSVSLASVTASGNIGKAGPGGALQFLAGTPATLSISNSNFAANESRNGTVFGTPATDSDGGAVAANNDTNTASVTNTNFTNNVSYDDGGALKAFNGAFTVTGGTLSGNTARDDGGAVWGDIDTVGAGRFLTLSGVTLQNNTANSDATGGGDGGAIFRDRGTMNVTNCTIGGLSAGQPNAAANGGAIAHAFRAGASPSNVTTINLDGGSMTGNNAGLNGGAVNFNATNSGAATTLNVGATTSVAVTENNANVHGGAFALAGGATVNLTRATVFGNDADKDNNGTGDGGGVYHANAGGALTVASNATLGTGGQGNTAENGGAIHHSAGTLTLNGAAVAGNTTDVHAGGLFVSGGTVNVNGMTFASNSSASGTEVRLTGGTTNFAGTNTIPGELSISGGALAAGSSTINLGEDFHFSSGTFTASTSTFVFNGTGAQQIYGGATPTFNALTVSNAAQPLSVTNNANANGTLTVNANAVLSPSATAVIGGTGTLTGSGTARVTRTAATADFSSQYTIAGKILANLLVDYAGAGAQTVSALTYGSLRLNNASGASLAAGTTTVNGTLTLQTGTLNVGTSTLVVNGGAAQTSGTFASAATGTVNYAQGSNGQSVLSGNYGNLTFSSANKVLPSSGTVGIAGTFTTGAATGHTVTGSTISFNGAGAQSIPSFTYNNVATATGGTKTLGANVTAGGNFTVGAGTTLLIPSGATLTVGGTFGGPGTIRGVGSVVGNLTNTGTLAPGLSPGILNVVGNFSNSGTLSVEIGGTAGAGVNPNGHDQVLVSGTATIGGNLTVTLTNGFVPAAGNSFLIVDAASASGTFATTTLPNIFPNQWSVQYNNANGTVLLYVLSPTAAGASLSGRVLSPEGRAVSRATVSAVGPDGVARSVQTNTFGHYRFENLPVGQDYTVGVAAKSYRFAPRVVALGGDVAGLDFVAEASR